MEKSNISVRSTCYIRANNSPNGNPQRAWIAIIDYLAENERRTVCFDEGYLGSAAIPKELRSDVEHHAIWVDCTQKFYHRSTTAYAGDTREMLDLLSGAQRELGGTLEGKE